MLTLFYCLRAILYFILYTPSVAILLSASLAGWWSRQAIRKNREILQNRETMALMNHIVWDAEYIEMRAAFVKARDGRTGIKGFIGKPNTTAFKAINQMMNHYELLAIGVDRNILSQDVLKGFIGKRLVADWKASKEFVMALRKKNKDKENYIFCEFENLAGEWETEV